jgi:hypothetical protein
MNIFKTQISIFSVFSNVSLGLRGFSVRDLSLCQKVQVALGSYLNTARLNVWECGMYQSPLVPYAYHHFRHNPVKPV